jgi:ATP-dependent Clp protease protease subunit
MSVIQQMRGGEDNDSRFGVRMKGEGIFAELIAQHTGQPVERVVEDSEWEKWFSADEAKEYGIVDHVVTSARDVVDGGGTA